MKFRHFEDRLRGGELAWLLRSDFHTAYSPNFPTVILGDFNEPSHADSMAPVEKEEKSECHTRRAVSWPVSKMLEKLGFIDIYRSWFKSAADYPGIT